jgi:cysteine desulfuration protein SufE
MSPIEIRHAEIVADFVEMDDWSERYGLIVEMGKELEALSEEFHVPELKVSGCVSQVWLRAVLTEGKLEFTADSDSIFVKGLIALLVRAYSGFTPEEILSTNAEFLKTIGITENLSPNRANGLGSMVNRIREYAIHYSK